MRTIKELLIVIRDQAIINLNAEYYMQDNGICMMLNNMTGRQEINVTEWNELYDYIHNNRPQKGSKHYIASHEDLNSYYWPCRDWQSRIDWLNTRIRIESRKENKLKL